MQVGEYKALQMKEARSAATDAAATASTSSTPAASSALVPAAAAAGGLSSKAGPAEEPWTKGVYFIGKVRCNASNMGFKMPGLGSFQPQPTRTLSLRLLSSPLPSSPLSSPL
jgi:hypothetical protein